MKNSAKKYLLLQLYLLLVLPLMGQNPPVTLPADGNWPTIVGDSIMLIGPKQEALTEEQRYFNPPYLLVYPGKEHLKEQMIRAALCDCDPTKPNRRIGVFSVAPDKQVSFSQGNLQYLPAANIWKFANTQYEYLGNANKYLTPTFRNWVDLFGWSANNTTAPFGVSTSTNVADYAGEFVDWGNNSICGDALGTWRTMSADEWEFLLEKRKNASNLYGVAKVAGENGLIILPDDWKVPEGIIFKAGLHSSQVNDFSVYQSFTADEWKVMEEAGAVFLHASGYRDGATVEKCNTSGYYWSNTTSNDDDAYRMYFYSYFLGPKDVHSKYRGRSVRLVHDTIVPSPAPCETFKVNGVTFNMMCVEGGTFMMGSNDSSAPSNTRPAHPVTLSDFHIGQTEVTRALWRAVMDTVPGSGTDDMPVGHVTWEECQVFLTKLSEMTGKHFRLPTEAEWEYAARGGNKNKDFIYSGSDYADVVGWINYESNKIMPVAQKRCNQLGIYDMTGNSWEWCQDGGCRSYTTDSVINPIYVGASTGHVIRGGSFRTEPARCTNIARSTYGQNKGDSHISLRLVMDTIVPPPAPCQTFEVKGVTFNMMCVEGEKYDYLMGQTEVTRALWKAVMGTLPNSYSSTNVPIDNVTWGECKQFIQKLNHLTGLHFRFPTKEEWQYAAKGGKYKEDFLYSGSDDINKVGWCKDNTPGGPQPVATLMPNALGIYDMTGNVWEWAVQTSNNARVYLGGSSAFEAEKCLLSKAIGTSTESNHKGSIGLRLVLDTHQYVDLGLSVMWATTNVGAETPEQYGDYFAWGETEPKDEYSWTNYKWCDGTENNMTKYNATDGLTTLLLEDDAAHINWGGEWRMAGDAEWTELREQCDWKWTTINGTKGYTVTGPNGNSIFLSAAGFYYASGLSYVNNHGDYWSGTRNSTSASSALHAYFTSDLLIRSSSWRYYGFPVRPVLPTDRKILTPATPGKRIGVFSVAKDKQVSFSQGNLQYIQSKNKWQFAPDQLYITGNRHCQDGTLADTIMYFGWSGKNSKAPWGISLSINSTDYEGEFLDWGTNIICGDTANTWRTTSDEEWNYMLRDRKNADKLHAIARVDTINGLILLPNDWILPEGMHFEPTIEMVESNQYTLSEWSVMENAGAVFMPMSGYFNHKLDNMRKVNVEGYVRSNNLLDGRQVYSVFKTGKLVFSYQGNNTANLFYAFPVRLVRDTIIPQYVDLGLSVKWANYNLGASTPSGYGDYFAWGETEPKEVYSWETYKWCNPVDTSITKYNNADGLTTLQPEDDAATVNLGGQWRMPTKEELAELREQCTWEPATINGVKGAKVTGPNGNSIFIPLGGSYNTFNDQLNSLGNHGWIYSSSKSSADNQAQEMGFSSSGGAQTSCSRCVGLNIRPVVDDKVTVTVVPTTNDATVGLLSVGYTREGNSITVDQGKSVLYLVSNVEGNYLSKGDSLINLTQDTTLYVGLEPFSDDVWEPVDDSLLVHTPNCYISRNNCVFAKYDSWNYYVMPASEGETYRIQTIAGQLAAPWIAVSSLPDFATLTRASKIACSPIRGVVGYLAEEFTVPAGTKYLIFNHRTSSTYPLKVEKKSKYRYGISSQYWEECNGLWGHGGRGHAVQDQSPIQGTIVQGVRLNLGRVGSLNIYKIPSLFGSTEDNFQLVATITTDSLGLQDIDFPTPIYVGENEYLVFGKPSEITPTLTPMYNTLKYDTFKQNFVHFIGTDKVKKAGTALMVDFY